MTAAMIETVVALEALRYPPQAYLYAPDVDIAERAAPIQDMIQQAEIRARHPPRTTVGDNRSSPESDGTLTPESNADIETQYSRLVCLTRAAWRSLLARFGSTPFSRPTTQDVKDPDKFPRYDRMIYERVADYPEGWPQLAAFINSDDTFANFRRFGLLFARVQLHLQNELTELEKALHELDKTDDADPVLKYRLRGYEDFKGNNTAQRDLVSRIRVKLCEYADLRLKDAELRSLSKLPSRNHLSLYHWIFNNGPLGDGKDDFIFHIEDFVSATKHSENGRKLEDVLESLLDRCSNSRIKNLLKTELELKKTDDQFVDYYSPFRLAVVAKLLLVSLVVTILLIPVFLLFLVPMTREQMAGTVLAFGILFSVAISSVTGAKVHDVFVGTAACCAMLVTFLGNLNGPNGSSGAK